MTLLYQELTGSILNCAYKVHSALGPGLLESVYEECLHYELDLGYRIDLLVESKVILEVKSVEALNPVHMAHNDLFEIIRMQDRIPD
jgi:hypothetical protein